MASNGSPLPFPSHLHTIFVDTSLDTHLAMAVSIHDTISDVKAKIRAEHALCFQDIGEIAIQAIKVRRRDFFYNLTDSMCVWNAFDGVKGSWSVCVDAVPVYPAKNQEVVANKVTPAHLVLHSQEGVAISSCEPEKNSGLDGQGSHNLIVMSMDHEHRPEMLIEQEKDGGRKNDLKKLGIEASDAMPATRTHKIISGKRSKTSQQDKSLGSQSQHYLVEKKRSKKVKDGLCEENLEDRRGRKFSRSENFDEHLEDDRRGSKIEILAASSEGFSNILPHEDTLLVQNSPVEKQTKKRKRKSSKSHGEARLDMSSETLVARSPRVTTNPHNSWKEAESSIFYKKHPIESNIDGSFTNDARAKRIAPDTVSLFEVDIQKEKEGHSMETCMVVFSSVNKEPIEDQILQDNPEDRREKHVNLGNVDVRLKVLEEARISSLVPSKLPTKLYCSTDKLTSQSSKVLEPKEANDQQSREFYAAKCITELNPREDEAGSADEKAGIYALSEKFSYEEQTQNTVSKNFSGDEHQGLDKETDAAANLKGPNKDRSLTQVDSKVLHKSRRSRKKLKTESSRVCKSTEVNGDREHLNSDFAQVSLNDVHHEYNTAKIINQADQKANGGHFVDTMIEISSLSKKVPNQDQVFQVNSGNPPISTPHNLSEVSNPLVEQAPEIRVPSQPASEVQAMPRCSKRKSKSELSKHGSPEISNVVLEKSNGEVNGSNEGRVSDPSKLAIGSNQKIKQHWIDANVTVGGSVEDFSKFAKLSQVNPLDPSSCQQQDLCEQANAKIITKEGDVTHMLLHGALAGPTKYTCGRKKSKKEVLKTPVSSEMSEHMELGINDNASINFSDYFVPKEDKHSQAFLTADSPTDLVQSASHKRHMVEGPPQENDISHHDAIDAAQDTATTDSRAGNARKAKNTKKLSKQNLSLSIIESNSFLHKAHEYHKLAKKLQDYGPQTHVQLSKSGDMESKQGKKVTSDGMEETLSLALHHGIDNMVSNDECVQYKDLNSSTRSNPVGDAVCSHNFDVFPSEGMANQVTSSDNTEDTPYHLRRFRVVRKIPIRRSKKITSNSNPEKLLLASFSSIFCDASGTRSDGHLGEMQTKTSALKLSVESAERGEIVKEADGRTNDRRVRPF